MSQASHPNTTPSHDIRTKRDRHSNAGRIGGLSDESIDNSEKPLITRLRHRVQILPCPSAGSAGAIRFMGEARRGPSRPLSFRAGFADALRGIDYILGITSSAKRRIVRSTMARGSRVP